MAILSFAALIGLTRREPVSGSDYQNPQLSVEERVEDLLGRMTLDEKLSLMATPKTILSVMMGMRSLFETSKNDRLGIPPFCVYTTGGSRGANSMATAFPVAMARGASWDRDLEYRVHGAIALEAAGFGMSLLLSPVLNIVRHPGMGRAQETYGEDTFHMGEMGASAITGIQNHLPAQVKHYALNSIEENRYQIDIQVDERTLREIYLPHYKKAVQKAKVASVMTSYNKVNGTYASENKHLLRDILKGEWGFDGFVMSDWLDGVASTVEAANNGLDIEMPIAKHFKRGKLKRAIAKGHISEATVDDIVRRILRRKFEWGHFDGTKNVPGSVVKSPEHRALALEAAREGMTLLKNVDNALPLDRAAISNLVVLGCSADDIRLGDLGSSQVRDDGKDAVSPLKGIIGAAQTVGVEYYTDLSTTKAQEATSSADAVVVIASLGPNDEGEWIRQFKYVFPGRGGDRRDLSLHAEDVALIKRAAAINRRVIVVIQAGSAVTVADWVDDVEAVLMAWYPSVKGGIAIGETLFGDNNPSGKTPISWPVSEEQLYEFGSRKPSVVYGFYQGYRYYDHLGLDPQYPFGHGLSYTSFDYGNLSIDVETRGEERAIVASFDVTNSGTVLGKEVAQLYVGYIGSAVERAVRDLKGFDKIALSPGETKRVTIAVPMEELSYWDTQTSQWVSEDITYRIDIGASSRDIRLSSEVGGKS